MGTVKARLFRARQRLRQMLLPYIDGRVRTVLNRNGAAGFRGGLLADLQ